MLNRICEDRSNMLRACTDDVTWIFTRSVRKEWSLVAFALKASTVMPAKENSDPICSFEEVPLVSWRHIRFERGLINIQFSAHRPSELPSKTFLFVLRFSLSTLCWLKHLDTIMEIRPKIESLDVWSVNSLLASVDGSVTCKTTGNWALTSSESPSVHLPYLSTFATRPLFSQV